MHLADLQNIQQLKFLHCRDLEIVVEAQPPAWERTKEMKRDTSKKQQRKPSQETRPTQLPNRSEDLNLE